MGHLYSHLPELTRMDIWLQYLTIVATQKQEAEPDTAWSFEILSKLICAL